MPATWDLAGVLVALEHTPAHGGWQGRWRSNECCRRADVGAARRLRSNRFIQCAHVGVGVGSGVVADGRVGTGRVYHGGLDLDGVCAGALRTPPALFADREPDLVFGAARGGLALLVLDTISGVVGGCGVEVLGAGASRARAGSCSHVRREF